MLDEDRRLLLEEYRPRPPEEELLRPGESALDWEVPDHAREAMLGVIHQVGRAPAGFGRCR